MSNSITSPFGELPSDWVYQPVVNYVEFLTGPAFDSTKFNTERFGARLVRGINLTRGATRWAEEKTKYWNVNLEELKKFQLAEMDILIGMDGSLVGKNYAYLKKSDLPALLVQRVARLRAKEQLDSKYLYYMYGTDSWVDYVEIVKTSSGIPHISNGDIKNFLFPYPPLPEQKKIAAILTSVDDVIEKTQAQIDKLKDLKTGMMQDLLTRGVGVDGKPHTEFKDSPVGRIPKGWEVRYIADCCSKMTNGYVGSTRDIYVEKGVDYILCQNVRRNVFVEKTYKYVRQEFHQKNIRACLQEGDVLTVQTGAGNGDTCVVPKSYEGANCHALIISRPKKEILNPYFLAEYMNSDQGKQRVSVIATGGAHPHLNTTDLRREVIPLPPIEEQNQMVNSIRAVQKKYLLLEAKKKKFEGSKKALMQALLTGKVRVKVDS